MHLSRRPDLHDDHDVPVFGPAEPVRNLLGVVETHPLEICPEEQHPVEAAPVDCTHMSERCPCHGRVSRGQDVASCRVIVRFYATTAS